MITAVSIKKRIILLVFALVGLVTGIVLVDQFIKLILNKKPKITVQSFDDEHTAVLNGIRDEFKIAHDDWQKLMDEFGQAKSYSDIVAPKKITNFKRSIDPLTNRIKQYLADGHINPDKVTIFFNENKKCPIMAVQEFTSNNTLRHELLIDKEWFLKRPEHIQEGIIKHEMQHLKHLDSIEGGYIIDFLLEKGIKRADYEKSKSAQAYRHHRELRADLLAGAGDINVARALQEDFAKSVTKNYHEDETTHPSSQKRYDEMTQLIAHMKQNSSIKVT